MTASTTTELYAEWIQQIREVVQELRRAVTASKHNEEDCCRLFSHTLEAVMSLEQAICTGNLKLQERRQLPSIVADLLGNIELARSVVEVNSRHWNFSSCTCVPWSQSVRRKLIGVSDSMESIGQRARKLQIASLEETASAIRSSGNTSGAEHLRSPGLSVQNLRQRFINPDAVHAMKQALRRFSSDKGTDLEDIRKSQEQLEEASEHNPIQAAGQRPTLSTQIRASFNKSGLTPAQLSPQVNHVVPMASSFPYTLSEAGVKSSLGLIPAGLPMQQHELDMHHVRNMLTKQDAHMPAPNPNSASTSDHLANDAAPAADVLLSSLAPEQVAPSGTADATAGISGFQQDRMRDVSQSSLYAAPAPSIQRLSPSAAVPIAHRAASLHRRASLAAKLQQMAGSANGRSIRASPAAPSERNSLEKPRLESMPGSPETDVARASSLYSRMRTSLDQVRETNIDLSPGQSPQQISNAVNSKAAGIRQRRLSDLYRASCALSPSGSSTSVTESINDSIERPSGTLSARNSQASKLAVPSAAPKRTLSDAALEALESVESMQCPIIQYSQLQIQRKIGDGSIGQVYLAKWQETDVAVKVIKQMQNLSPTCGTRPQGPEGMPAHPSSGDGQEGLVGEEGQPDLSDHDLTAITTLEKEVSILAAIRHPNVAMLMGLCLHPICVVTEFCARGSLSDVLQMAASNADFGQQLDWRRRLTMALDAAKGMWQLHSHPAPILHRDLKSPNLLVDKHWRVKVTDFNLSSMIKSCSKTKSLSSNMASNPRWLAPEVVMHQLHSQAADVYSFGIVLWELMTWQVPWDDYNPFQIIVMLTKKLARPEIPDFSTLPGVPWSGINDFVSLMQACWHEDPGKRPGFNSVIASLRIMLLKTISQCKKQGSGGGSNMLPDSPRQLNAEAHMPWRSSVTTLSRAGSSAAHTLGSDPKHSETIPQHASRSASARSPPEHAAKQGVNELPPKPRPVRGLFETAPITKKDHPESDIRSASPDTLHSPFADALVIVDHGT